MSIWTSRTFTCGETHTVSPSVIFVMRTTDADDWLTIIRTAQRWPQSKIEDYVAALAAGGPLIPANTASTEPGR